MHQLCFVMIALLLVAVFASGTSASIKLFSNADYSACAVLDTGDATFQVYAVLHKSSYAAEKCIFEVNSLIRVGRT